jgi:hypothetical protein
MGISHHRTQLSLLLKLLGLAAHSGSVRRRTSHFQSGDPTARGPRPTVVRRSSGARQALVRQRVGADVTFRTALSCVEFASRSCRNEVRF